MPTAAEPDSGHDRAATSRFEYRVFAPDLAAFGERLRAGLRAEGHETRADRYVVGARTDRNVKLRGDDALDVKALRETRAGLERWEPVRREPFPLDGAWIREELAEILGVALPDVRDGPCSADVLLREIVAPTEGLAAARVEKQRERFAGETLLAEYVRLRVDDAPSETVAVESADANALLARVRALALDRAPNTSYVRWLHDRLAAQRAEPGGSARWAGRSNASSC